MKRKKNGENHLASLTHAAIAEQPLASYKSRLRAIGNSKGVILSNPLIEMAGLDPDADLAIVAARGIIYIIEWKDEDINTDLSTWDRQFKAANKNGATAGPDLFEGLKNNFDNKEW